MLVGGLGAGVVHAERGSDLGEAKPLDGAPLPGLALLVDGDTPLLNQPVEARSGDSQSADSLAGADHRFLLHDPTVADVPSVPVVPNGVYLCQLFQHSQDEGV